MEARVGAGVVVIVAMTVLLLLFGPSAHSQGLERSTCDPVTIDDFAAPDDETKAKKSDKAKTDCIPFVYTMGHPLAIPGRVISDFGDERDGGQRLHMGTDVAAPTLTPVLAVADGVVATIRNDAGTDDCCWVSVEHDDGWASLYIHLNNDLFGTDDGSTSGVRRDLAEGDRVAAGQILGWVGDSGNAENTTSPHLHFVLLNRAGTAVDAGASIAASASKTEFQVPDDQGHPYRAATVALSSLGILWTCDETGLMTCPNEPATVDDLTRIAVDLLGIDVDGIESTYGIQALHGDETPHEFLVEKLMGCPDDECRPRGVTRSELARLAAIMSRSLISEKGVFQPDLAASSHLPEREEAIDFLRFTGGLQTCELPLDTSRRLTRGEAAYLLIDWLGVIAVDSCPETPLPVR